MKIRIEQDTDPMSPRDWDNTGIMACFHTRYVLGDDADVHGLKPAWFDGWDEMEAHLRRPCTEEDPAGYVGEGEGALVVLPLYLYNHSGLTMRTASFSCPWDSGQVGFIYATKDSVKKMFGDETPTLAQLEEQLKQEVKIYDQYLTGDVWSYAIYRVETCNKGHEHEEIVDSCCGFFGQEDAKSEADAVLKALEGAVQ